MAVISIFIRAGVKGVVEVGFVHIIGGAGFVVGLLVVHDLLGLLPVIVLLFLVHFKFSFGFIVFGGCIHGYCIIDFLSNHIMESRSISRVDMKLILRNSLGNSLLGDTDLFDRKSWDTNSGVRGMDGHGIESFHGNLFSLVFSSDHFVSGDLGFTGVLLENNGSFSGIFLLFSSFGSVFLSLLEEFLLKFRLFK